MMQVAAIFLFIIVFAVGIEMFRLKWRMHKNPPYDWEMDGDYIKEEYFDRIGRM